MAYGASAGTNYDGLSIASLAPGIYENYELSEVKSERTTKADGTTGKQILTFLFDGPNGQHQHTEYEVDVTDAKRESKEANLFKRVAHIMTKYVTRQVVDAGNFSNFTDLANWVVATLAPQTFKGVKVSIKVLGNVYNGEARANFPGYPPFIARPGHAEYKQLFFSDRENAENGRYFNHVNNATPDQEQNTSTSSTPTGGKVDTDF